VIDRRNGSFAALGFFGGLTLGALVWSRIQREFQHDLFSRHPLRRLGALSFLRTRPSVGTARLLREYIAWERSPALRQRGVALMRRVEASLP